MSLSSIKAVLKDNFPKIFPPYNPYKQWIDAHNYLKLVKYPKLESGRIIFSGNEFLFSDSPGLLHSLEEIFLDEIYSFKLNKTTPCIVDCGSNIGLSIIYLKSKYPDAEIIGFEPDKKIFGMLEKNIKAFDLQDVKLYNAAVWTENTTLKFYSEGSLAGSTEVNLSNTQFYSVEAMDLKELLQKKQVDFLKIDIEGAENALIFDIKEYLPSIPYLFLEYHSIANKEQQLGAILSLLTNAGYRYYILPAYIASKEPFATTITSGFDIQLNIFCKRN